MKNNTTMSCKMTIPLAVCFLAATGAYAVEPAGYYSRCENKKGAALLEALCGTVGNHTAVGYDGLWDVYETSDIYPEDGKVWDMYSTKHWNVNQSRCGNYKAVGDCYNREHSFPKSWFDDRSPMVCDAFHVYPTDGKVNGQRSNHPYGECAGGTTLQPSNGVRALGRLGSCTFPGYSGTVFEPDDQYKGDFARSYFYMAAAYNGFIDDWDSPMLAGNSYPAFSQWAINLLLKWHREDPVSSKEISRNDAVYAFQKNRNPFIDHPELAEHIWGDRKTVPWTSQSTPVASLALPVDGSTLDFGTVPAGRAKSVSVRVRGENLQGAVSVAVNGTGYSVSPGTLTANAVCSPDGTGVTVTLTSAGAGEYTGILTLTAGSITSRVNLTATAVDGIPARAATNISDCSFTANWVYVGDEADDGSYMLHVRRDDGTGEFSVRVKADEESYDCDGLEKQTAYEYWLTSATMESNVVKFSTRTPIPMIQLLYEGDLYLEATTDAPSQAYELIVDTENIEDVIEIGVAAPFAISSDKSTWGETLAISPEEERFYIRLNSGESGLYSTTIVLKSGAYHNDQTVVSGRILATQAFCEDFEADAEGCDTYNGCAYHGSACAWRFTDAGIWASDKNYANSGKQAVRMGKSNASRIEMTDDKPRGIGTVTLSARCWSDGDGPASFCLEYSNDGGNSWEDASAVTTVESTNHNTFTFTVNVGGSCRIAVQQISGKRFVVDDITITDYEKTSLDGVESDYHSWDAFCRDGVLVIESRCCQQARVYGVDGIIYHDGRIGAGISELRLPHGLYIVAIDDFTRSVLVK